MLCIMLLKISLPLRLIEVAWLFEGGRLYGNLENGDAPFWVSELVFSFYCDVYLHISMDVVPL